MTTERRCVAGRQAAMTDTKEEKGGEEDAKYGGCEGPDAMYVKLVSSDCHEFIVKREHALTSGTIKAMLSGPGTARCVHTLTDRHSPMAKKKKIGKKANLAKPEIPHTTKIYFVYCCMVQDNPYLVQYNY